MLKPLIWFSGHLGHQLKPSNYTPNDSKRTVEVNEKLGLRQWLPFGNMKRESSTPVKYDSVLLRNIKVRYFYHKMLIYGTFCRKTLKYSIFCRKMLKYGCKTLKYALRENNSKWSDVARKPHNLCCPGVKSVFSVTRRSRTDVVH